MRIEQHGPWQFAIRRERNGGNGFVAWGKRGLIETDCPLSEPGDTIHFGFGPTEEDALRHAMSDTGLVQ